MENTIEFIFLSLKEWDELREGFTTDKFKVCLCVHAYPRHYHVSGLVEYPGPESKVWLIRSAGHQLTYTKSILSFIDTVHDMRDNYDMRYLYIIDSPPQLLAQAKEENTSPQEICSMIAKKLNLI